MRWDDVIVGGGSAGAVLAARLSEEPSRRVLLLEAGADTATAAGPIGSNIQQGANWDHMALVGADPEGVREYPYPVGKVLGGSSAVNGAIALRGSPADFGRWRDEGNDAWSWERVLPFYRRLEADADFGGPAHGRSGPVPIRRIGPAEYAGPGKAFLDACRSLGLPELADLNAGGEPGVGALPVNWDTRRMSTADTYLAAARHRPNLTIRTGCRADRVVLAGGRATGVEWTCGDAVERAGAGRVTLSAGAVGSPAILQRSGIGDAGELSALGIAPVADLPGVGRGLSEHPALAIWTVPPPGVCDDGSPWHSVWARVAGPGDPGVPEVSLSMLSNVATSEVPIIGTILGGRMGLTVAAMLLAPRSRGSVLIRDADPGTPPRISLNLLAERADMEAMMRGARHVWSVLRSPAFAPLAGRIMIWTQRMVDDDDLLVRSIRKFVTPQWHASGTARMGTGPGAVVDQGFRVHGVDGLRVVDASVMPFIPSAPLNLTCMMLGERAAAWMD